MKRAVVGAMVTCHAGPRVTEFAGVSSRPVCRLLLSVALCDRSLIQGSVLALCVA